MLQAQVFTDDQGRALDWLVVEAPGRVDWDAVIVDLDHAAAGDLPVHAEVAKREQARDVRPPNLAAPVPIRITSSPTGRRTVRRVEVHGPDSPGVLFRVSRVLADLGTELLSARVATLGPEVRDTFFLVGDVPDADELEAVIIPALLDTPAVADIP